MGNDSINKMHNGGSWGAILETHVFNQIHKTIKDWTMACDLYFWRTNNGAEVDFIIQQGERILPLEVKSAIAINTNDTKGIMNFIDDQKLKVPFGVVVYRGEEVVYLRENLLAIPLGLI